MSKSKRQSMRDEPEGEVPCQKVAVGPMGVKAVKVWEERAEVRRETKLKAERGALEVQLLRFPSAVDKDSIRVDVKGARLRYAVFDEKEERAVKETEARKVSKDIKKMKRETFEKGLEKKTLDNQRTLLEKAAELGGVKAGGGVLDPAALNALNDAIGKASDALNAKEFALTAAATKLNSKTGKAEKKLEKWNQNQTRVTLHLEVKDETVELELAYIVKFCAWSPLYEVRLDASGKKMTINYLAVIKQSTGEDWTSAKVSVATDNGGKPPPLQRGLFVLKKMGPDEQGTNPNSERSINIHYEIPGRKTITGDGAEHRLLVTEMELDPVTEIYVIPKQSLTAYVKARAVLKSAYTMVPGTVLVYRDSNLISRQEMPRIVVPKEEFSGLFGPETGIRVEYQFMDSTDKTKDKQRRVTEARMNIKNKGKEKMKVTVLEQVPISRDPGSGVKVSVLKPDLAARTHTDPVKLNRFHHIEWNLDLAPDEARNLEAKYVVEYPLHEDIVFK